MGYWKDQLLKQQEQGWSSVDSGRVVCAKCFEDYAIQDFIRASASERKCSYCGRRSKKPIAVPMNDVLELIGEGLGCEYADPAEQNPWDEGEYVFPTMDSRELFDEIGPIAQNDDVHEEIVKAFSDRMWNEKDLFGLWEGDALRYGWKYFVKAVKYQRRYVFLRPKKKGPSDSEVPTPDKMLDRIGQVINEVELVRTMDAGLSRGGLVARGTSRRDNYRHVASYVDKIPQGAEAADLPWEWTTKLEVVDAQHPTGPDDTTPGDVAVPHLGAAASRACILRSPGRAIPVEIQRFWRYRGPTGDRGSDQWRTIRVGSTDGSLWFKEL